MYRHILVPLDDSPLSADTLRRAVEFARAIGAKVTFFHAQEDYGASSLAALERVISPALFDEHVAGEARAILSRAEVVAREAGVAHGSLSTTSNRPYEAILLAAEKHGCDLIFISSHGRRGLRGLVLGSQTQKLLQHASIPVLVCAVESNLPAGGLIEPLVVIGEEHRSLAAVIHGLEHLVREARAAGEPPSFALLHAMLHYIREFPEKLHHPKEEAYLFRRLRARTHVVDDTLDELERQHLEGHGHVEALARAVAGYQARPDTGLEDFAQAVARFAAAQMAHMRLETKVILPAARQHLTAEDWAEIGRAFSTHGDPRFGADDAEEFRQLFARIQNLVPGPAAGAPTGKPI